MVKTRGWHVIQPNKSSQQPVRHLFVDIETTLTPQDNHTTVHTLKLGWCCYWRRRPDHPNDTLVWTYFETEEKFWDIVKAYLKPKEPLYLIAHNVGYDLSVLRLFDHMERMGFDLSPPYLASMTVIMDFVRGQDKLVVLDNTNYFRCSLAELGKSIGFPKEDVNPLTAPKETLIPYCKRDVEIMLKGWQFLYAFRQDYNLGAWGRTISSLSMNAFRHRFMSHKVVIHTSKPAVALERSSYHGGRTSAFVQKELHGGPYYKLDVNSMYPFIMRDQELPWTLYNYLDRCSMPTLKYYLKRQAVIAHVTVETNVPVYPVRHKNHLVHPVGRFDCTLTTPELKYALEHGHLRQVYQIATYRKAVLFAEYVSFFHGLKTQYTLKGDQVKRNLAKYYLNTLSGKWGQYCWKWEKIDDPLVSQYSPRVMKDMDTGKVFMVYRLGTTYWRKSISGEGYNAFPAIIAHITAYARLYLWELLCRAGTEHCFYCDTDSLIVDQIGYDNLLPYINADELGALKVEETTDSIDIRCPKVYRMGTHWKRKGIPSRAVETQPDTWEFDMFPSFLTQAHWKTGTLYHTTRTSRHLTYRIFDGIRHEDGKITPHNALALNSQNHLPLDGALEVSRLEMKRDSLRESRPVPHSVCFALWSYRKGNWKKQRLPDGSLVPLEYSDWDAKATELGFSDLEALKEAVTLTMNMEREMAQVSQRLYTLLDPTPLEVPSEPTPF